MLTFSKFSLFTIKEKFKRIYEGPSSNSIRRPTNRRRARQLLAERLLLHHQLALAIIGQFNFERRYRG